MRAHDRNQHFFRHIHKFIIDCAQKRHRPFNKPCRLADKPAVFDQSAIDTGRQCGGAFGNHRFALCSVNQHIGFVQSADIVLRVENGDGVRGHKAMAISDVAAFQPANSETHGLAVKQA